MSLVTRHSSLFTAVVLAAMVMAGRTAAAAAPDPGAFGICEHVTRSAGAHGEYENRGTVFDRCAAAGIGWLRCDIDWQYHCTTNGTMWWQVLDDVFASAESHGVQLLPILTGYNRVTGAQAYEDLDAWSEFVRQFVTRYKDRISAVEVWNEEDYNYFWTGTAEQYAALLKRTYTTVKAVDSSINVVLGGLTSGSWSYLSTLYSNGIKNSCDVIAFHPYCQPKAPDADYEDKNYYRSRSGNWLTGYSYTYYGQLEYRIRRFRDVMSENGDGSKPIWITELGWPSSGGSSAVSEAQQASYLTNAAAIAFANGVEKFFAYELKAPETDSSDVESHFGILHSDFTFKPAYLAYRDAIVRTESGAADPYANAVFLLAGDNWNVQSFATAGNWSDGAAPHSDADYLVANLGNARLWFPLRGDTTFGGRSLAVGRVGVLQGQVRNIGWGNTITIGSLALNRGRWFVAAGGDAATGVTLAGAATVNTPASEPFVFAADALEENRSRFFTLASTLSGAAGTALRFVADGGSSFNLVLSGNASSYAGEFTLDGGAVTGRLSAATLVGPSGAGSIALRNGAALAPFADGQVFDTGRTLTSEDGTARIDVPSGQTFTLSCPLSGTFRKTGAGTLVMDGGTTGSGRIVAAGGDVRVDIDTTQFVSGIDGGRVVYCVPAGSLSSRQSIATVSVPGPLAAGDVVVSDGAAAPGWTAAVRYEENATEPDTVTAYIDVTATPRTVVGTDSFEAYAAGTAAASLPGWTGHAAVVAGTPTTGDPPGVPLPDETHTRVLALDGDNVMRTYADSFARDSQSIDFLIQVAWPSDETWQSVFADDGALQLRLAFDTDGAPCLLHADDSGAPVWTRLGRSLVAGAPSPAYENGAWVRVSIDLDYSTNPSGLAFAQVRLDGSCLLAAAGWRTPAAKGSGGSWFRLPVVASSARKVSSIDFDGRGALDDLVLACHDPALVPDFPSGAVTSAGNVPFAWFDAIGIPRDPLGDPDGDGLSNAAEYRADTDPLDAASHPPTPTMLIMR